jgi:hypothetical protein
MPNGSSKGPGASIDNTIWIYEKEEDKKNPYHVHPSPKVVRSEGYLYFKNFTNKRVSVPALRVFAKDLTIEPNAPPVEVRVLALSGGRYSYQVNVGDAGKRLKRAHGHSDPDLIIP